MSIIPQPKLGVDDLFLMMKYSALNTVILLFSSSHGSVDRQKQKPSLSCLLIPHKVCGVGPFFGAICLQYLKQ
jgi:hypothetical protein